ncbi:MAG: hypothetical protein OHK0052_15980 [Anaerolineales bacterium]
MLTSRADGLRAGCSTPYRNANRHAARREPLSPRANPYGNGSPYGYTNPPNEYANPNQRAIQFYFYRQCGCAAFAGAVGCGECGVVCAEWFGVGGKNGGGFGGV